VAIEVLRDGKLFAMHSGDTTYVFAVDDRGLLRHLYWGDRFADLDDFVVAPQWDVSSNDPATDIATEEYPCRGQFRYKEHCLAVTFHDGSREIRPTVVGHEELSDDPAGHLLVRLADTDYGLAVDLHYRCVDAHGLLERWAEVRNESQEPITVNSALSAQFHIPHEGLTFHNTFGHWGAELQPFSQQVSHGKIVVENRKGTSGHNHTPAVVLERGADEEHGAVWFAALRQGGNFRAVVEQGPYGGTSVGLGINDYDFAPVLGPGESLTTPAVIAGRTTAGFGGMSARMHAYGRSLIAPQPRLVLYNSWEATGFDVTADNQMELAQLAARIGAELFVLDDGWFGRRSGTADGLGDWWVSLDKFPDGLQPLIAEVNRLGMQFGLWIEPEMVNPAADLYRQHPDWVHRTSREPDTARDQLVLDLGRSDVQDFVVSTVDRLLTEHDIDYLKWDANRPISQVGTGGDAHRRHTEGLYRVVDLIKRRHPAVLIEACASGGGRVDLGALTHFDDFWPSDNTDALDRLTIQTAYSLLYPMKAMRAWVTDAKNFLSQRTIPLQFRFHSAMMGSLGVGADLTEFDEESLDETAKHIAQYKQLRGLIQEGRFHRIASPDSTGYRMFQFADDNSAALFVFLPHSKLARRPARVRLRDLDPAARYRFYAEWQWQEKSGAYLMQVGIPVWLFGDYASTIITFERT
jgi:alpha-galactosidase